MTRPNQVVGLVTPWIEYADELEAERDKLRVGVMAEAVAISNLTAPSDTALRSVATRLAELLEGEG